MDREYHLQVEDDGSMRAGEALLDQSTDRWTSISEGQKKNLEKDIEDVEENDFAMWSVLTQSAAYLPRRWKFVFEIFCGYALLTRMCQARGYPTCEPLDVIGGWNVFGPKHRQKVHEILDKENPYLLAIGFPCGPWSPWQNVAPDQDEVQRKR